MTNQVGHQARMECLKASVDQRIEEAQQEKGLLIVYTVHLGDVLSVLRDRPTMQHVVITDRGEPAALLEKTDLVTEMKQVKRPFRKGIQA
ncbi:cob(I)yrinic acid a,c-diamide adenosyltransferase [Nitrospira sp. BLG_2]|uniref:cob(I)yrinic acid a,c-diamide adenosyltransferase n=1 Tax=Nitrospira sp. BLG_2 TaxID=3397507 RepID=UPI003B9A1D9C